MNLFPYPIDSFIPKLNQDNLDAGYTALINKLNSIFLAWFNDLLNLYNLKTVDRCKSVFLDELGYMLAADIQQIDTERQKRQKIAIAVQTHKLRGTWIYHAKPMMDTITGYSAALINNAAQKRSMNIWVECDGVNNVGSKWAPEGDGDVAGYLGIKESVPGGVYNAEIPGYIYINCHVGVYTAVLSAATIANIVYNFSLNVVPAYEICQLAYIDASGFVTNYTGGTI
jgi:hypothetical protein